MNITVLNGHTKLSSLSLHQLSWYPQGYGMVASRRSLGIRSQPSRQWRPWCSPCLRSKVVMIVIQCPFLGCLPQDLKIIFETQISDNFNLTQVHSRLARILALNPDLKVPASEASLHPCEVAPWSGCHTGFPPIHNIPSAFDIRKIISPIIELTKQIRRNARLNLNQGPLPSLLHVVPGRSP